MTAKSVLRMAAWVALILAFAAAALPAQSMAPPPGGMVRANETPGSLEGIGIDQRLDESLPLALPFRDEAGRSVTLGDYFGKRPVVLALVYYNCPMLCTQVLNGLVASLNVMSLEAGKDFDVVAVSFDPRETPAMAAAKKEAYLSRYKHPAAAQGWHFLTGDAASVAALTKAAGFRYRYDGDLDLFAHASAIVVATPQGRLARYFYGIDYPPRDLRLALVEASAGRIGSLVDQVLLLCLHYDPATGRYGLAVQNALRLGGGATVLLLGGFVVRSLLADRRRRARAAAGTSGGEV